MHQKTMESTNITDDGIIPRPNNYRFCRKSHQLQGLHQQTTGTTHITDNGTTPITHATGNYINYTEESVTSWQTIGAPLTTEWKYTKYTCYRTGQQLHQQTMGSTHTIIDDGPTPNTRCYTEQITATVSAN